MSKLKYIICGLIVAVITLSTLVYAEKRPEPEENVVEVIEILSPSGYVDKYAKQYGVDANILEKVMLCESNGNINVKRGDGGLARGVMQFHEGTFNRYSREVGEGLSYDSYKDQIQVAAYMFSIGQARQWTTYRALMNGGVYVFTDRKGVTHTVRCK